METAIVVVLGLVVLLGVVFTAFVVVTLLDAAFNNFNDLEFDDADDLFDEEHHVRPLLGVVHPKEK
jgi:hypothetical protein